MRSRLLLFAICSLLLALGACSHEVPITATVNSLPSRVGDGFSVALLVVDDRDGSTPGLRASSVDRKLRSASTVSNDLIPVLEREISTGLKAKGFTVLGPGEAGDSILVANLRAFKFFHETGLWTNKHNVSVVLRVEAEKSGRKFRRTYRSSDERSVGSRASRSLIDETMNSALSAVMTSMVSDEELLRFLTQ